jgi:hypothetical protein
MRQRDYRDWQKRQLRGDVRPWPVWVRVLVWIGLAVALAAIVAQIWG